MKAIIETESIFQTLVPGASLCLKTTEMAGSTNTDQEHIRELYRYPQVLWCDPTFMP